VRSFVEKAFAAAGIEGLWSFAGTVGQTARPENEVYRRLLNGSPTEDILVRINPAFYRLAEVQLLLGDATRARTELGWAPRVSFDDLVKRMTINDLHLVGLIPPKSSP
jgi:GDPmannose 4,6-dehydratase